MKIITFLLLTLLSLLLALLVINTTIPLRDKGVSNQPVFISGKTKFFRIISGNKVVQSGITCDGCKFYFGNVLAPMKDQDPENVDVFVPPCEFNVTKWDISVGVTTSNGKEEMEIGTWTYSAQYPDRYDIDVPETNVAIMWISSFSHLDEIVLESFLNMLDRTWRFQIFTTKDSDLKLRNVTLFAKEIRAGRMETRHMENMTLISYTHSMLSVDYWRGIHGDRILIFQNDVVLCKNSTRTIDYYFKYDIVTAPWTRPKGILNTLRVGNSGFSLRKRKMMLEILSSNDTSIVKAQKKKGKVTEDRVIALFLENNTKYKLPPRNESVQFSVERTYYPYPIGLHKGWFHWGKLRKEGKPLYDNCPLLPQVCREYSKMFPSWKKKGSCGEAFGIKP